MKIPTNEKSMVWAYNLIEVRVQWDVHDISLSGSWILILIELFL